ncbi:DUF7331 family protein [Halocatena marina]|uniref:Uncharacterized protein n=1 Tax=Halocatena marina TaxID=2934937 RepID=A0ABD5YJY2_9EURY|nr:hypothetical protein [Halocatena marina]
MSTRTYDSTDGEDTEWECIVLELEDGDVVMYDPSNHCAWVQSDASMDISSQV